MGQNSGYNRHYGSSWAYQTKSHECYNFYAYQVKGLQRKKEGGWPCWMWL